MSRLSICIASYQRREMLNFLVHQILATEKDIEVCVHIDGSTDGSLESLQAIGNKNLKFSFAPNAGKAHALPAALRLATRDFVIFMNDDDYFTPQGLAEILQATEIPLDELTCGFIFHLLDEQGRRIGTDFPVERSNFLELRADFGVTGDKLELVRRDLALASMYRASPSTRRMANGVIWAGIAQTHQVICINADVAVHRYLEGGYTKTITQQKLRNPLPQVRTHWLRTVGYPRRRYRSFRYFARSALAAAVYGAYCGFLRVKRLFA